MPAAPIQTSTLPWTGFDLINTFNAWKKTENAGRVFTVDTAGVAEPVETGLAWRTEVCQQVFGEAAVDCGKGLTAWSESRSGKRKGKRVGFPKFKKKTGVVVSFRLRNKHPKGGKPAIRVGDRGSPPLGDVARYRRDRGARRHSPVAAHARQGSRKDPVRHHHSSCGALVGVTQR